MGNAPIRNEQRRINDEAHEARIASFEKTEAAAKARREGAARSKPGAETDTATATPAKAKPTEE